MGGNNSGTKENKENRGGAEKGRGKKGTWGEIGGDVAGGISTSGQRGTQEKEVKKFDRPA